MSATAPHRGNGLDRDTAEQFLADLFGREVTLTDVYSPGALAAFAVLQREDRPVFDTYASLLNRDQARVLHGRLRETERTAEQAPRISSAAELMTLAFLPILWLIPGILPEGLMLLAARPKVGKSWLALLIALACATGGKVFGRPVTQGRVLYLALEDNDRRMHARLAKLGATDPDALLRFEYATSWPRGTEGAAAIREWIEQHEDARLVVIDVFAKLRETTAGRDSGYATDYQDVAILKPPPGRAVTVLLVHHTRKQESDDALDTVSGTLGIGGAADGALILRRARGESEAELHLIGRDLEDEGQYAVQFDRSTCRWEWVGEAWKVRIGQERREILAVLADGPATPAEIATAIGKRGDAVRYLLRQMVQDGQVDRGMDRRYRAIEVPT